VQWERISGQYVAIGTQVSTKVAGVSAGPPWNERAVIELCCDRENLANVKVWIGVHRCSILIHRDTPAEQVVTRLKEITGVPGRPKELWEGNRRACPPWQSNQELVYRDEKEEIRTEYITAIWDQKVLRKPREDREQEMLADELERELTGQVGRLQRTWAGATVFFTERPIVVLWSEGK
jgi:hypothetical protein